MDKLRSKILTKCEFVLVAKYYMELKKTMVETKKQLEETLTKSSTSKNLINAYDKLVTNISNENLVIHYGKTRTEFEEDIEILSKQREEYKEKVLELKETLKNLKEKFHNYVLPTSTLNILEFEKDYPACKTFLSKNSKVIKVIKKSEVIRPRKP